MWVNFEDLQSITTISTSDFKPFLGYCAIALAYRLVMCELILDRVGRILHMKNLMKFKHRTFDAMHYSASAILGVLSMASVNYGKCFYWAVDCLEHFKQNEEFVCTAIEKIYYFNFLAYYTVDILFIYTNTGRAILFTHHCATVAMVLLMVAIKMPAMGYCIMILHDITDVPLYVGKVLYYFGSVIWKDILMLLFAASCTYFRIFNLLAIIYQTWVLDTNKMNEFRPYWSKVAFWWLRVLYLLHLNWEWKILKILYGVIAKRAEIKDTRSDEEK